MRAAIHEVILLRNQHKDMDAVVLAGKLADTYKKSRSVEVLKMLTAR